MTTSTTTTGRRLSDVDEPGRYAAYDALQARMPAVWADMRGDYGDESVVVVPSVSLESSAVEREWCGDAGHGGAERSSCSCCCGSRATDDLRHLGCRSTETIVDYYLALLPGVIPSHGRPGCAVSMATPRRPVTAKLLERPRLLGPDPRADSRPETQPPDPLQHDRARSRRRVSLGIPMYGADPKLRPGQKSGCRRLFAEGGVPHPLGRENLHSLAEVVDAIVDMRTARPSIRQVIVKLNEGYRGGATRWSTCAGSGARRRRTSGPRRSMWSGHALERRR